VQKPERPGGRLEDVIERAHAFFIACRQSLAGRMNEQVSAWLNAIEGLPAVHARLKRVAILNRPAVEVIRQQDGPRTLFYCDPPYLHETRETTGEYAHEMTVEQHEELLETLAGVKGRFLLSGYPSELYDRWAQRCGWRREEKLIDNKASGKREKEKKVEVVWRNC
jgi:DNA adenine methylase